MSRIQRTTVWVRDKFRALIPFIKNHPRKSGVVALACLALIIVFSLNKTPTSTSDQTPLRTVQVASLLSLSQEENAVPLVGEVRSRSRAELRTLAPGEVVRVFAKSGDTISAGALLVEFENASERASVLQAQGVLESARAQYQKALAGARTEDALSARVSAKSAQTSLTSAYTSARSAYAQALSLAQDAVYAKLDTFFRNPYTTLPSISVSGAGGTESTTVERERVEIQRSLDAWKKQVDTGIPDALLETRITEAQQALARMQTFAGSVGVLVSRQNTSGISGDTKATQEATALAGRSTIDSARTLLVQAQEGITNAKGGSALATLNEEKVRTGDRPEDIAVYRAQVTQAEGALAGALAQLEKKRIRSPISGTVSSLTVSQGDFVPAYTVVAVITNDTGLEIETSVSETVLPRIQVGMVLAINTHATGTVTSVATGLDPSTKKARVTVSVPENAGFVEGSFISLTIPEDALAQKNTPSDSDTLAVPILAIKVLPEGLALLTVDEQGILHTLPVQEGAIVGERMLLRETLDPNTKIVVDARGLTPETKVNIQ